MASEGTNNEEKVEELDIPEGKLGTSLKTLNDNFVVKLYQHSMNRWANVVSLPRYESGIEWTGWISKKRVKDQNEKCLHFRIFEKCKPTAYKLVYLFYLSITKGFGFLLIFTGFLTISSTAETILRSYKSRNPGSGDLNGLLSQSRSQTTTKFHSIIRRWYIKLFWIHFRVSVMLVQPYLFHLSLFCWESLVEKRQWWLAVCATSLIFYVSFTQSQSFFIPVRLSVESEVVSYGLLKVLNL